jgi:ABC-type multidrug transport system ATPase subunit
MALLLGPPGSGKSTLLLALAAKLDPDLRVYFHSSSSQWFIVNIELTGVGVCVRACVYL